MSINPMTMGISANYSLNSISPDKVQAAATDNSNTAAVSDSVQLGAGSSPDVSPVPAKFIPAALASNSKAPQDSAPADNKPQAGIEATQTGSASSDAAPAKDSLGGADTWHIAGGGGINDTASLTKDLSKEIKEIMEKNAPICGTDSDDTITITANEDNSLVVTINGEGTVYSCLEQAVMIACEKAAVIIDGGAGNDTIIVDKNVTVPLRIVGGAGNDTIVGGSGNDTIIDNYGSNNIDGGAGDDVIIANGLDLQPDCKGSTVNGGEGRDYIEGSNANDNLNGDTEYDVIYGLGGDDNIHGGAGNDYLDGGEGNDTIYGDEGNDNLVGGKGNDSLSGGTGDDLLIGASGSDSMSGNAGSDRIISSGSGDNILKDGADVPVQTIAAMEVPSNFITIGDEMERARLDSDLETLAHIEHGQMMFSEIAATGHKVTIGRDSKNVGDYCASKIGDSIPRVGSDSEINYSTTRVTFNSDVPWNECAPIVALFHEMCHSYNAARGDMDNNFYNASGRKVNGIFQHVINILQHKTDWDNGTKGLEYQAMGVDNPSVKPNPHLLTENGLRELLGQVRRDRY